MAESRDSIDRDASAIDANAAAIDANAAALHTNAAALAPHFKPEFLAREETVFQFQFETDPAFYLVVAGGEFSFHLGTSSKRTLTLYVDHHQTCWDLLSGQRDGMQAFMDGQYRADGNIVLSQLLLYLFKRDDPTVRYEVQD